MSGCSVCDRSDLRPFDPSSCCPKCGWYHVTSKWIEGIDYKEWRRAQDERVALHQLVWTPPCILRSCPGGWSEHIDRECPRCSHRWAEKPLRPKGVPPKQDWGAPAVAERIIAFLEGDDSDMVHARKAVFEVSGGYRVTVDRYE